MPVTTTHFGTATVSGCSPFTTPYLAPPGLLIALDAIVTDPEASMFTVGDVMSLEGLVMSKEKV